MSRTKDKPDPIEIGEVAGLNYEEDLRIDVNSLDIEWLDQPSLFMHYAEELAFAHERHDRARERRDVVRAEVDNDVRKNPTEHFNEGVKVTNSAIEALVVTNELYKKANEEVIQAKLDADLLSSAVRAMEQRKVALENLARLHGQSYFAGPKEPRDLSTYKGGESMFEKGRKARSERANEKRRSRRKRVKE